MLFARFRALFVIGLALAPSVSFAQTLDKVTLGTNWAAQAELGGFYQALGDGTYKKFGLDVTIVQGDPQVSNRILLPVGKLDFTISTNNLESFDFVAQNFRTVVIAAIFQKDPLVLLAHPSPRIKTLEDLKDKTFFLSKDGMKTYFQWLKVNYKIKNENLKPYTIDLKPFLRDTEAVVQGYITSEPYIIERQGRFTPKIFPIHDYGFNSYAALIETRLDLIEKKPMLVQRFVDASIIGWYNYLYGDNRPGNDLIKHQNSEMTDQRIAYSIRKMKEYGIVDSGDALSLGIGAMTNARILDFFDKMVRAGVVKPTVDFRRSYTLRFVNKKVGINLRPAQ